MSKNKYTSMSFEEGEETNYGLLLTKLKAAWPWFLLTFVVFLGAAFMYVRYATPMYNIHALVRLTNSNRSGGAASADHSMVMDLGAPGSSNVDEESVVLQTGYLMEQVVKDMHLNITYFRKGDIRDAELYTPPFTVELSQPVDSIKYTYFEAQLLNNGKIRLETEGLDTVVGFNEPVRMKGVGTFYLSSPSLSLRPGTKYAFTVKSIDDAVKYLSGKLEVALYAKQVSIIELNFTYPEPKKGEDILNRLLQIYVQNTIDDKNRLADSSVRFIHNRLSYLGAELGDLEGNIQSFKQRNRIAEMSEQSRVMIQNSSQVTNDLAKIETQISVLTSVADYLKSNAGNDRVVPSSLVVSDPTFNNLVEKYNTLLLERDRRMVGVTEKNPVIENLNERIANLRTDMLSSLSSNLRSLNISKANLQHQMQTVEQNVQGVPGIERNYLDLARQQQIKQELYIFLMQKSEEAAIAKTYNTPNSKNIDPPKATGKVSPKEFIYYTIASLLALIVPSMVVYTRFLMNNRVESKEDVQRVTSLPVIGELTHSQNSDNFIVARKQRSAIAEQFRAIRTKMSFYLKAPGEKVILVTSSTTGEGKSFFSINLASVLALSGRKVLMMDLDLRKAGLSAKLGIEKNVGFTSYINDLQCTTDRIIKPSGLLENLYLVSSGVLPPNPAELLLNPRVATLFGTLKEQFDYIIVDAPPVGLVTDAQLLAGYTDLCIYLVRHNFTLKSQLEIPENLSAANEIRPMAIVINDIKSHTGSYGASSYYYEEEEPSGISGRMKKLFKRG